MGLAMVLATVIGLAAGYWVDARWGTAPSGFLSSGWGWAWGGLPQSYVIAKRSKLL